MQILESREFTDNYLCLPDNIKKKIQKVFKLLLFNPRYPSLNLKKLKGVEDIWYGRIVINYRFTFQKREDMLIMRRIGYHDDVIKNP